MAFYKDWNSKIVTSTIEPFVTVASIWNPWIICSKDFQFRWSKNPGSTSDITIQVMWNCFVTTSTLLFLHISHTYITPQVPGLPYYYFFPVQVNSHDLYWKMVLEDNLSKYIQSSKQVYSFNIRLFSRIFFKNRFYSIIRNLLQGAVIKILYF